jgi:hypothetical protein
MDKDKSEESKHEARFGVSCRRKPHSHTKGQVVKPWMKTFGKLGDLRKETARINRIIQKEFDQTEAEDPR